MRNKNWIIFALTFAAVTSSYQPVALAQAKAVNIDARTKKQLAELFTVMSRNMKFFQQGKLSNKALIQFGIFSQWDVPYPLFKQVGEGNTYRLSAKHVESAAARYFGRKVKHTTINGWTYRAGYYTGSPGDAGLSGRVVITNFAYIGKGLYSAHASHYDEDNRLLSKEKLTLKKISSNGKTRFIVVEYLKA